MALRIAEKYIKQKKSWKSLSAWCRKSVFFLSFPLLLSAVSGCAQKNLNNEGPRTNGYLIQLPYEEINNKIIVNAVLEGRKRRFLFDTGAFSSLYSDHEKAENPLGLKIKVTDSQSNSDSIPIGTASEIALDHIIFYKIPVLLLPPDFMSRCLDLDGIIGSNLLKKSIVQFDTNKKRIIITDDLKKLNLNRKHRRKLILDKQSGPVLPVHLINGNKEVIVHALFDSGFDYVFDYPEKIHPLLARNNTFIDSLEGFGSNSSGIFGDEMKRRQMKIKIPMLRFGDLRLQNFWTQTSLSSNSKLGMDLLNYGTLTLDYLNKEFYFNPFKQEVAQRERDWGISPIPLDGKMIIGQVWEMGNQEIKVGDEILEIDGQQINEITPCDWFKNSPLKNKEEAVLTLTNMSKGIYKVHLKKRYLD